MPMLRMSSGIRACCPTGEEGGSISGGGLRKAIHDRSCGFSLGEGSDSKAKFPGHGTQRFPGETSFILCLGKGAGPGAVVHRK